MEWQPISTAPATTFPRHPLGDSMIDLEELKRLHSERVDSAFAQRIWNDAIDSCFPAIVAKLEAAQRLRDAVVGHFGTEGILKWPEIAGSVVAFNRADKEQQ